MIIDFLKEIITGKANKFMLCALVYLVTDQAFLRSRVSDLEMQNKDCNEGYKDILQLQIQKAHTESPSPDQKYHSTLSKYYLKPKEQEYEVNYYHIS